MAGANVFHVEFGFNDTELTRSLEEEKYHVAEQIIYDNAHTAYLDEGCYQRTALNIVLCGHAAGTTQPKTRNLYIAKLLVQCGASPNFRVPESDFGIYLNPGKTPLELVIDYYNRLTGAEIGTANMGMGKKWSSYDSPVIGLDNVVIKDYEDLLEQLCSLVFIFLSHGGDANIQDIRHKTALHRTVVESNNISMAQVLCENGADLNAMDRQGDTPLMCSINDFTSSIRDQVIEYLLSRPDIEVNQRNKFGRSALFLALLNADQRTTEILLSLNCDVTTAGKVWQDVNTQIAISRDVSPIFAALCSKAASCYLYDNFCTGKEISPHFFVTSYVDSGYFSCESVQEELKAFLNSDFPDLIHLTRFGPTLMNLMFGASTSNLKQLATRKIFTYWVLGQFKQNTIILSPQKSSKVDSIETGVKITYFGDIGAQILNSISIEEKAQPADCIDATTHSQKRQLEDIQEEDESDCDETGSDCNDTGSESSCDNEGSDFERQLCLRKLQMLDISRDKLEDFVIGQNLPMDALVCFEIELFRLKLFLLLQKCSVNKRNCDESYWLGSSYSDDSDVTEENESDLEYW